MELREVVREEEEEEGRVVNVVVARREIGEKGERTMLATSIAAS